MIIGWLLKPLIDQSIRLHSMQSDQETESSERDMNNNVCVAKLKRDDVPFVPNGILPIFLFTGEEMKDQAMVYPFLDKHLLSRGTSLHGTHP